MVSLIERQGSDVLRSGLALRENSCRVDQKNTDKGSQEVRRKAVATVPWWMQIRSPTPTGTREEGARVQGLAVLSSFSTTETSEQLKDDEKKGKKPGNGTRRTHE